MAIVVRPVVSATAPPVSWDAGGVTLTAFIRGVRDGSIPKQEIPNYIC